jgi:hypothetical protein
LRNFDQFHNQIRSAVVDSILIRHGGILS